MKRLIASEEERRRLLRIECRTQPSQRLFGPVLRRAFGADAKVDAFGRDEHPVGVLEAAGRDTIEPDREGVAESGARLLGRADEIRDDRAARLDDPIAHPAHASRMLDPVGSAEAEITGKIRTHGVSVEHDRVDQRRERRSQRGLARSWEAHDQDLAHQWSSRNGPGALREIAASSRLGFVAEGVQLYPDIVPANSA
jgi:D-serine deaminase-like pyridoxal phosphate-dependent protein